MPSYENIVISKAVFWHVLENNAVLVFRARNAQEIESNLENLASVYKFYF